MICPNCQNEVAEGAAFCSSCGNKMEQVPPTPVAPQESMPTTAEPMSPVTSSEAPLPPVEPISPISNTPAAPEMTAMPVKKSSSKKAIWITVAVVVGLLVLGAGGFGVYYYLQQSALKKADAQLQEAASKLDEEPASDSTATSAKAVKISSPNDAYKFAMTKITYTNPGVTVMKMIAKEDGSFGSYEVTVIDRNSSFKKDGYNYFKAKKVSVNQTGQFKAEDVDHLGGDSTAVLTDFGNVELTNDRLATVVSEGKKDLLAKGYKLGSYYAVFFTDDQSNLSGSKDKFEVYYTKAGQDETTKGYKKLTAYVVQLEQPNLTPLQYAESSLGFILE